MVITGNEKKANGVRLVHNGLKLQFRQFLVHGLGDVDPLENEPNEAFIYFDDTQEIENLLFILNGFLDEIRRTNFGEWAYLDDNGHGVGHNYAKLCKHEDVGKNYR